MQIQHEKIDLKNKQYLYQSRIRDSLISHLWMQYSIGTAVFRREIFKQKQGSRKRL
jgi:hypothetical protein